MLNLFDLTRSELVVLLAEWGFSEFHARRVWHGLYRDYAATIATLPDIRLDLRQRLAARTTLIRPKVITQQQSSDGYTRKFLLAWPDDRSVETVIMAFGGRDDAHPRLTACVSTQAGCAMGCVFCATGQMGFYRHLTPGEIVAQVLFVQDVLAQRGESLRNIVLMGMGEPLHNYDNTMRAIDILLDHHGLAFAPKHITLSTVGIPSGIRRMADENRPIRLAVSLHAATDAERMALVPPARRWPLAELLDACRYYIAKRGRHIFFEWALINGENDGESQAHALGQLLDGVEAHLNLIPLNPTGGYEGTPSDPARVKAFQRVLAEYGIPSTVRQRRGIDIAAGCGQLQSTVDVTNVTVRP